LTILALAVSVTLKAATLRAGTSNNLGSSVMVPTTTAILSSFPLTYLANLDKEIGALLILDILTLLAMVLAKSESALRPTKLEKRKKKKKQTINHSFMP
jgi:hypothetical protein